MDNVSLKEFNFVSLKEFFLLFKKMTVNGIKINFILNIRNEIYNIWVCDSGFCFT